MKILAIETATEACSAALVQDGNVIERYVVAPREHNRLILSMIEAVLAEAGVGRTQIDAVAFGRGPGSFTGLRIAAGVTQGIAYGLDCPVLPVSTLAALAFQSFEEAAGEGVYACLDARMGEIYGGLFRRGQAFLTVSGRRPCSRPKGLKPPALQCNWESAAAGPRIWRSCPSGLARSCRCLKTAFRGRDTLGG
jgi:tRNA threonylcarbamoyl adenosine modification protein YeaZ